MRYSITVTPVAGDPFEVLATASKYSVNANDDRGTLRESVRFRFDASMGTVSLGYSIEFEGQTWVVRDAQLFRSARRIVVDADRESLDHSRCECVDIYMWETDNDCNAKIYPKLWKENVLVSVVESARRTVSIHDTQRTVTDYRVYMEQDLARQLNGRTLIRGKRDLKINGISGLDIPGKLATADAVVQQAKLNQEAG